MDEELPETGAGPRIASSYARGSWRIPREIEEKYDVECPEWLAEVPTAGDGWREVREITRTLSIFHPDPTPISERASPTNHRPSTVFDNELDDMTAEAIPMLRELFDADAIVTEMPYASNFRTDIVACQIDAEKLHRRIDITGDASALNEEWRYIRSHRYIRRNGPLRREEFVEGRAPYVEKTSRQVWNWLDDRNLLADAGRGYYTALDYPIHVTAHAIELKQRDWETALNQVQRATKPHEHCNHARPNHKPEKYGYADYQWVGIDAGQVPNVIEHIDRFKECGVGLIGICRGGAVKLVDAVQKEPPARSIDREHINEKSLKNADVNAILDAQKDGESQERTGSNEGRQSGLDAF